MAGLEARVEVTLIDAQLCFLELLRQTDQARRVSRANG